MFPDHTTPWRNEWTVESKSGNWANTWLRADEEKTGSTSLINPIEQSVWIYSCITAIAEQIAHIPFRFSLNHNLNLTLNLSREGVGSTRAPYKNSSNQQLKTNNEQLESGPLPALFNSPNQTTDRFLFWDLLVSWLLLRGKACLVATDNKNGLIPILRPGNKIVPTRLYVLNPDRITKIIHEHELFGYKYSPAACDPLGAQTFIPEELLSIRLSNPFDHHEGLAPASIATLAAQTDYASAQFMKGLMLNNADTGLIVSSNDQLSPDQIEAIKAALRERKRKAGTADRPLFLWGNTKVEKPTLSAVDLQFLENRKFNRQEICSIFRVPQEILGFTEDANRSVAESARLNFLENRIAPLCERLAAGLSPILKPFEAHYKGNLCAWFDIESLPAMQKARRDRFTSARRAFDMGVPINVCNTLFDLGLPTDLPHAEYSYLPSTLQQVSRPNPDPDRNPTPAADPTPGRAAVPPAPTNSSSDISVHRCSSVVEAPSHSSSENPQPSTLNTQHRAESPPSNQFEKIGEIRVCPGQFSKFLFAQRKRVLSSLKTANNVTLRTLFNLGRENSELAKLIDPASAKALNLQTDKELRAALTKTTDPILLEKEIKKLFQHIRNRTKTSTNPKPTTTN